MVSSSIDGDGNEVPVWTTIDRRNPMRPCLTGIGTTQKTAHPTYGGCPSQSDPYNTKNCHKKRMVYSPNFTLIHDEVEKNNNKVIVRIPAQRISPLSKRFNRGRKVEQTYTNAKQVQQRNNDRY